MSKSTRHRKQEYVISRSLRYAQKRLGVKHINLEMVALQQEYIRKYIALTNKQQHHGNQNQEGSPCS